LPADPLSAFEAAEAAPLDVTFVVPLWDRAEPAADFAAEDAPGLRNTFDAAVAADLLVTSDLAIY